MNRVDCPYCDKYTELDPDMFETINEEQDFKVKCKYCLKSYIAYYELKMEFFSFKDDHLNSEDEQ